MATIDTENAKQIRQPMDVIIKVTIEESANLTYTHSNTAKIADDVLDEPDWAMRKLADLQGDGFELDSSAHVYDSDVPPSLSNGKIGVRTVVAAPVIITVTSDTALNYITVKATGASYVTYDNVDYSLTSGYAIIPVGGQTSFSMEFVGESIYKRVEVSDILPGIWLEITNENLISAVVSLRSDLSIIEPTLPESEINVEVYYDDDISEILAAIPDETPLTYQAGYHGDMSPVRKFYISEQITWADNVITIHAVDAVYKLNKTTEPVSVGDTDCVAGVWEYGVGLYNILTLFYYYATNADVPNLTYEELPLTNPYWWPISGANAGIRQKRGLIARGNSYREILAEIMNLFHFSGIGSQFRKSSDAKWGNFWPTYVDAGIPTITSSKPVSKWDIYEEDCGEPDRNTGRKISSIRASLYDVTSAAIVDNVKTDLMYAINSIVGSFEWEKNTGGRISMDKDYVFAYGIGLKQSEIGETSTDSVRFIIPVTLDGWPRIDTRVLSYTLGGHSHNFSGHYLVDSQTLQFTVPETPNTYVYTQDIPWDSVYANTAMYKSGWRSQANAWAGLVSSGVINADTTQATLDIFGFSVGETVLEETFYAQNQNGIEEAIEPKYHGHVWLTSEADEDQSLEPATIVEAFPEKAVSSLMEKSTVTGSFRWKGDPRMQPRDVVTFHRLDGTSEEITLENITLTHEGGGTVAEITYRKGVV